MLYTTQYYITGYLYAIRMSSYVTRMSFVRHSYVLLCHLYVTRMYPYVILLLLVCTRMSPICHSQYLYVIRMSLVCVRLASVLVCTRMSPVCHLYVLACQPYVTRIILACHSYVLVCHSYVLVCHPHVTCMYLYVIVMSARCTGSHPYATRIWFSHEPFRIMLTIRSIVKSFQFPKHVFLQTCLETWKYLETEIDVSSVQLFKK